MSAPDEIIGLIGTGLMGSVIARKLLDAGFAVLAWDHDAAKLATSGAALAGSVAEIAAQCSRIVLSLPDSNVVAGVLEVMLGSLGPGSIVIDTSTGEPEDAVRFAELLAQHQCAYLDATVSGSSEQLRKGEALSMVGGEVSAFERCADIFAAFGGSSLHVGGSGNGARMKLVTNLVLGLNRAALAEGLTLAGALGLDLQTSLAVLQASAASSRVMEAKGMKMIRQDFTPVARLSQHLKDVRLMLNAASRQGITLPLSTAHRQLLEQAEAMGLGGLDNSAIIEVYHDSAS